MIPRRKQSYSACIHYQTVTINVPVLDSRYHTEAGQSGPCLLLLIPRISELPLTLLHQLFAEVSPHLHGINTYVFKYCITPTMFRTFSLPSVLLS